MIANEIPRRDMLHFRWEQSAEVKCQQPIRSKPFSSTFVTKTQPFQTSLQRGATTIREATNSDKRLQGSTTSC